MSNALDQQWKYAFQFSLPIQAVTPLSRDPNLLPLPVDDAQPPAAAAAEGQQPPPGLAVNRLTTVNLDVQNLIMSLLPTPDLSALTRTCRYFLDTGLRALCARIPERVLGHRARVVSLYAFLRSQSGPLSRCHLVTDLHFNLPYEPTYYWDAQGKVQRAAHINAFLGILRSCRHLRRLRIDGWFKALPASLLLHTLAASLAELEELVLAIAGRHDVEEKDLRKLGQLPRIRRIAIQASSAMGLQGLQPIAGVLQELDRIRIRGDVPAVPFANVQMLGVWTDRDPAWLEKVTTIFPNVSVLVLRARLGTSMHHRCHTDPGRAEDDSLREYNGLQWRNACAKAWPSLKSIWAHDLCGLYCIGMARRARALSVPLERPSAAYLYRAVLTDTQPDFLEVRIDLQRFSRHFQWDGMGLVDALTGSTVRCLALSLDFVYQGYRSQEKDHLEFLARALGCSPLTHVLIRYRVGNGPFTEANVAAVAARAPEFAALFARSSSTLRWIGVDLSQSLLSWEVSRLSPNEVPSGTTAAASRPVTLTPMSDWMGTKVVAAEGMDVFAMVRS